MSPAALDPPPMLDALRNLLAAQPLTLLFLTIGLGYLLSRVTVRGVSLGVATVLFVGLGLGMWGGARFEPPEVVSSFGLLLFVYAIGLQAGPLFFRLLKRRGLSLSALALAVVAGCALLAVTISHLLHLSPGMTVGLFCGALTNTPALAAATDTLKGTPQELMPTVGYSIAYPLGVLLPIAVSEWIVRARRIDLGRAAARAERDAHAGMEPPFACNVEVLHEAVVGRPLAETPLHDLGVQVSRVQHGEHVTVALGHTVLAPGDVVHVVGPRAAVEVAASLIGREAARGEGPELRRDEVDFRRIIVSNPDLVGQPLSALDLEGRFEAVATRLRRGDRDFVPGPLTVLERGDRLRVVARHEQLGRVAEYLGDSMSGFSDTDFLSVSLGMVLGLLLGVVRLPLPGGMSLKLGLAGGPLLVALVLGWRGRTGRLVWSMPPAANAAFRQLGLVVFFAAVGLRAGGHFAEAIATQGVALVAGGAFLTLVSTLSFIGGATYLAKLDWVSTSGALAGGQTQPALLAFAGERAHSEAPNVIYTALMPTAMIAKIVVVQLILGWR